MKIRRNLTAAFCAVVLGVTGGAAAAVLTPGPAAADGAMMFPGSRQFLCWQDLTDHWWPPRPANPACQSVVDQAGLDWYWNWYANLNPTAGLGTPVPSGQICDGGGAGPYDFSPFNQARDDWPRTHLTAGATYEFRHVTLGHFPGRFDVYLTTNGWNPNTPLAWSELELVDSNQDPPIGQAGGGFDYHFWNVAMPAGRDGYHVLFVHWVRSDAPTHYFSCVDVVFDGGNGEVTFPGVTPAEL